MQLIRYHRLKQIFLLYSEYGILNKPSNQLYLICRWRNNTFCFQMYTPLPLELENIAKENCNESAEIRESSLISLKAWLKKTPHLKARTNDHLLLSFLRYCRYSLEDTKKRIDSFYSLKNVFPEVMSNRVLNESLKDLYRKGIFTLPVKPLRENGPRILISQYSKYDPKATNPREVFKLLFMILEILANEDPYASVSGVTYVIDARDVTMKQMLQYEPYLLKKTWTLVEQCLPIKFCEIHMINMRKEGQTIFNFVSSFLPVKMPIKFIVHKRAEDLYDHIPRDSMNVEYGGHNGYQVESLKHWENIMLKYEDYFADDDSFYVNEKLRVGSNTSIEISELSGLSGSFRKLEVD